MAAQREAWSQLHGTLAHVAALAADDPRVAGQALLRVAKEASLSKALMKTLEGSVPTANPDLLTDLVLLVAEKLNMAPLGDSEPVKMIDEHSNFCERNVDHIINCSPKLSALNAAYAVISIVGAQSSGKSYLMNRLFGTTFPEMNAKLGRGQTSRGIMISRCIGPSLLLLDVEGFDGREKGQDKLFEKQAALFALAVSDLMMVNISIHDIGRDQGGSMHLFNTIFKERTKMNSAGITKILVVVRFWDGETPLDLLRKDVMESLEKSWESVNEKHEKFKDYIEVNIIGLPDKKMPEFPNEVTILRKLVSTNKRGKVPASSFSDSSRIFWDTIKKNKELHIPSHQRALAIVYCKNQVDVTLKSLDCDEKYKSLQYEVSPRGFEEISHELLAKLKAEYDLRTKMYDHVVRDKERNCLVEKLYKTFTGHSKELIRNMKENTLEEVKGVFDRNAKKMKEAEANLYANKIVDECIDTFMSSFEDLKLFDSDYLKKVCGDLQKKMQIYTASRIATMKEERAKKERDRIKNIATHTVLMGVNLATGGLAHFGN